jgi:hypothetical protein
MMLITEGRLRHLGNQDQHMAFANARLLAQVTWSRYDRRGRRFGHAQNRIWMRMALLTDVTLSVLPRSLADSQFTSSSTD